MAPMRFLIGEHQEVRHRRLLDDRHGAKQPAGAGHQLAALAGLVDLLGRHREEVEENPAEDLVLLQNLVGVESLLVAKRAQLHRFRDDGRVEADDRRRILGIVGDSIDEQRDVIQQLFGGKDAIRIDGHPRRNPLQPDGGQLISGAT
jgi:hypothetical protein